MKFSERYQKIVHAASVELRYLNDKTVKATCMDMGLQPQDDLKIDVKHETETIKRIILSYHAMQRDIAGVPPAYLPGSKWKPQIETERKEYLDVLKNGDADELRTLLRSFFRNSGVRSIIKNKLYSQLTEPFWGHFARREFALRIINELKVWHRQFPFQDISRLSFTNIGNPYGYLLDSVLLTGSSMSLNYYANKVTEMTRKITNPTIAEIGSGFGGFTYYLLKERPDATCYLFDLPEVLIIAQYFLMMSFPEKRFLLYGEPDCCGKLSHGLELKYDVIFCPNYKLPFLDDSLVDVFVNFHSLSEMGLETIYEYIFQIARTTKGFFYHENSQIAHGIGYGSYEVPVDEFLLPQDVFKLIYRMNAIWGEPRYEEFLYKIEKPMTN